MQECCFFLRQPNQWHGTLEPKRNPCVYCSTFFFCGAQIAIPRSGVILYLQSHGGLYATKEVLNCVNMSINLFLVWCYSGYSVPADEEPSQRTHRRKKKVNKGRWTKDEVRMRICKQRYLVDILLFPERRLLIMSKDLQNLKFRWKKCGSEMIFVVAQNCYCMARMEELSGVLGA